MDFIETTANLVKGFDVSGVRYALIGGFAVGLWGVQRNTFDLDFLVHRDDLPKVDETMARLGYRLRHRTDNVSHFNSTEGRLGGVDFLHAFRSPSLRMLERAEKKVIFVDQAVVPVLRPDDLIGLKLQAVANDSRRRQLDLYDVEELMRLHGKTMDWDLLEDYFSLFEFDGLFATYREKYREAE